MPGFVVSAMMEVEGELWLHVETTTEVLGCEGCGTRAVGRGRRRMAVRDLPMAGRSVVLVWSKRLTSATESSSCPTRRQISARTRSLSAGKESTCPAPSWHPLALPRPGLRGRHLALVDLWPGARPHPAHASSRRARFEPPGTTRSSVLRWCRPINGEYGAADRR